MCNTRKCAAVVKELNAGVRGDYLTLANENGRNMNQLLFADDTYCGRA